MPVALAKRAKPSRIVAVCGIAFGIRHTTRTPCGPSSAESAALRAVKRFERVYAVIGSEKMPPRPEWYQGREAVRQFFAAVWVLDPGRRRVLPLAAAVYRRPPTPGAPYEASRITLVTIRDGAGCPADALRLPAALPALWACDPLTRCAISSRLR
ncbi:MAG: hypothetical protein PVS2B3_03260 [Steroidobacteraceae bacterium]